MATLSSILAWRTPQQRSLEGYGPWGKKESGTTEHINLYILAGKKKKSVHKLKWIFKFNFL